MQSKADTLAQNLPDIEDLVNMATVISKKASHEFLLVKCKEQMIEFTKKIRGNAPKVNKLKAKLTRVIDEGGSSEEILDIESQIRELVYENVVSALKNRKNYNILDDERPSKAILNLENAKKGYNEFVLLNMDDPTKHPKRYTASKMLRIALRRYKREITLTELNHALFKKMKGNSAPGIDGFTINWLRKFLDSLKLVTFNAINECYRDGSLTSPLKTGITRLLRKGQKDPTLTGNYRPISLLSILVLYHTEAQASGR